MPRSRRQIDDDARTAADIIRRAERPMTAAELAEAMRRAGQPQTEKQGYATAARAEELGLLRKRGRGAWDVPMDDGSLTAPGAFSAASTQLFIECAKRLLELPPSVQFSVAARVLLEAATERSQTPQPSPAATTNPTRAQTTNGANNGYREVEILEQTHRE